jgi:hypothetical protein
MVDVFISHSSSDRKLAEAVTQLSLDCIDFLGGKVRFSSMHGYGLEIGSKFAKKLRSDIDDCEVFVAIISTNSLASQFCLFEIGAAWGLKKKIKPILAPGFDPVAMKSPLTEMNYLRAEDEDGWIQLIGEIAKRTKSDLNDGPIVSAKVREFCQRTTKLTPLPIVAGQP